MPWLIDMKGDESGYDVDLDKVGPAVSPDSRLFQEDGSHWYELIKLEYGSVVWRLRKRPDALCVRIAEHIYCDRFKMALESLEPGKHRFAQIDLRLPDGVSVWPEKYWFWQCDNLVDAIIPDIGDGDPERSHGMFWNPVRERLENARGNPIGGSLPHGLLRPVLNHVATENVHAWKENGFQFAGMSRFRFISDAFFEMLDRENLTNGLHIARVATSGVSLDR